MAANTFGASAASAATVRDTVGSEATNPNTAGSARSTPMSARQSPPSATAIARSSRILPGSCTANGLRHDANAAGNPLVNPTASAVRSSNTAPACDTTCEPDPSAANRGYGDVDSLTEKVLLDLREFRLQQSEFSQVRAPFPVQDTRSAVTHHESPGLAAMHLSKAGVQVGLGWPTLS